jgi:Gpi18-like mannosyltransferase/4-amino-4-deoxy-L-arabinose transferase-like glycosyltransferase
MTRDPVGRRGAGTIDTVRRLDAGTILAAILVGGLVLRILIAGVLLPMSGLANDIGSFAAWGNRMASLGPGGFYEEGYFADYPPGYLYVLWILGEVGTALTPLVGQSATGGLVKIPAILADVAVAGLLFLIARRWAGQLVDRTRFRVSAETLGLAAAAIYLFAPGVIFDSAVWGQVDSVGTLILLATIYALGRGWTEAAAVGAVLALLVKFQFGFLLPIVAIVGLKRHLFGRSSDPAHDGRRDLLRVVTSLAAGVVTLTVLLLPFGMSLFAPRAGGTGCFGLPPADPVTSLIGKFCEASETYRGLSIGAINIWRNPWSGLGDSLFRGDDTVVGLTLGGLALTWQTVGTLLFAAVALVALVQVARRDDMRGVLLAALLVAIAFFVLPTRVHERYLFPAVALVAPLVLAGRWWPWITGALSAFLFINIYWVFTADWSFVTDRVINRGMNGEPMLRDPVFAALLGDWGIWILGALVLGLLLAVLVASLRYALSRPAAETADAPDVEGTQPAPEPDDGRPPARRRDAWDDGTAGDERRAGGGVIAWLRPNAADAYLREPTRRLDRRDALILLGLVAFALLFRLWRLDTPRVHHFDEIYHGRSAAEFLSSWQEGWNRDVYEWTHPMLAKYLIAGGIVLADPNKVVDSTPLDSPPSLMALAPARGLAGQDRSILFTVADASTIVASDAETAEELARWGAPGPVASLAYDAELQRLLVGRADAGSVVTYELAGLLAAPDGRAPPQGPTIESELEAVNQVVVPVDAADPLLLRGPNAIATVDRETDVILATAEGRYAAVGLVKSFEEAPDAVVVSDPEAGVVAYLELETLEPRLDDDEQPLVITVDGATLLGPLITRGNGDDQQVLALTGPLPATEHRPAVDGGVAAIDADGERLIGLVPLPGSPLLIVDHRISDLVYVAGTAAGGAAEMWALEPHPESRRDDTIGLAAFDTTALPGTPVAMALDVAASSPDDDHARLLVASAGDGDAAGRLVRIDVGSTQFGWRLAGVAFGAALVGLVYLLAATMFSRRRVAVLAAGFVAIDGMSYVMSRISMNDIFVTVFIVAAYLVFWQVWSGRWARSAWWALPLTGVLIGLAASTKWVGFYALAGLLILVLARSNLGRLALVALVALATVVGGIGAPWPFLVVMLGLLAVALVITWARPIRIDLWDALMPILATIAVGSGLLLAFVVAFDSVEGARDPRNAVEYVFGLLTRGAEAEWPVVLMLTVGAVLIVARAFVSLRDPASDRRWALPGEMGGFAWPWVGACLVIVPLTVYGLSYVPYLQLGHDWATSAGPAYGWSLDELHAQMFSYHFNLEAGHASASPWWSWPLALKPTWFYGESYDRDLIAVIYNGGNPILFWAGIPALAVCAVLAWKRRSAALVLVVAAFAFQYVPWLRIERATFAYHYLTAVVFAMVAVAYLVDELLRRPAWRDLAIGYLCLVAVVGLLVFPLGSALPMPDWYVNAARALPPWNYGFQFPDPPSGDRAELVSANALKAAAGLLVAVGAVAFAMLGRDWWRRRDDRPRRAAPMPEGG